MHSEILSLKNISNDMLLFVETLEGKKVIIAWKKINIRNT